MSQLSDRPAEPPRAALAVIAHRCDEEGHDVAAVVIAGTSALDRALGTAISVGMRPAVVTLGRGRRHPELADRVVELDVEASDEEALAAIGAVLAREDRPPARVVVVPAEQPLSSGTLLWSLVARSEATSAPVVAAGHEGVAGHPRVHRLDALSPCADPEVLEASDLALFWLSDASAGEAQRLLATTSLPRIRITGTRTEAPRADLCASEEPLEIRLGSRPLAVVMRTPGNDLDLALGFLVTEAVVQEPAEVRGLRLLGNRVEADVEPEVLARRTWTRNFYAGSSCGVCGKASIDEVVLRFPAVASDLRLSRRVLYTLVPRLAEGQTVFSRTGGLHAAGLFGPDGELFLMREDVGRHNAVDKVIGRTAMLDMLPLNRSVLVVSGRLGFEIVQKAVAAGIPIVAAVSAPSSLAVSLARDRGVTVVGFLRGESANVYTHPERITE